MRLAIWMIIVHLAFAAIEASFSQQGEEMPYEEDTQTATRRVQARAKDRPLRFTGSVTDLDGRPIEGAKIIAAISHYDPDRLDESFLTSDHITVETDAKGLFTIVGHVGQSLTLLPVQKDGYEFRAEWNPDVSFHRPPQGITQARLSDDSKPIVLHMRKKTPGTYLLDYEEGYGEVPVSVRFRGARFRRSDSRPVGSAPAREYYDPLRDLEISIESCSNEEGCTLSVTTSEQYAGVLLRDRFLTEAPEEGYSRTLTFQLGSPEDSSPLKYLYVKTANPTLYGRIELKGGASGRRLRLWHHVWVNPFGKRNLEKLDVNANLARGVVGHVLPSLEKGELPKEPDFTEVVRLTKEYHKAHLEKWETLSKGMIVPITFFGKVVDAHGQPIEGVEIGARLGYRPMLELTDSTPGKMLYRTHTDGKGLFRFENLKGSSLSLYVIRKRGYEFSRETNPKIHFDYSSGPKKHEHDADNPVVFHLRKRGATTFLYEFRTNARLNASTPIVYIDFFGSQGARVAKTPTPRPLNKEEFHADLAIQAERVQGKDEWKATFSAPGEGGGVTVYTALIYEAPSEGYATEASVAFGLSTGREKPIYLLVQSRTPSLFTRIKVDPYARKDSISLSLEGQTNPYGERNLEKEPAIPPRLYVDLRNEAAKELRRGRRPTKPDLPKLIEEAQRKSLPREKGLREQK